MPTLEDFAKLVASVDTECTVQANFDSLMAWTVGFSAEDGKRMDDAERTLAQKDKAALEEFDDMFSKLNGEDIAKAFVLGMWFQRDPLDLLKLNQQAHAETAQRLENARRLSR